jgi:hypothetical protein
MARSVRDSVLERRLSLPGDAAVVAVVMLVWRAVRVPIEGGSSEAVAHARSLERLHSRAGLRGLQDGVIDVVHHHGPLDVARWSYSNLHVFSICAFMVAMRAAAPARYPTVRTAFVLLHIPALIAIAVYPLGSPTWLPHAPEWAGGHPPLGGAFSATLRNQTAAVASEHFGYPVLTVVATLWAARNRWLAAPLLLYPPFIFMVIVGTGHHFVLDAAVGAACALLGLAAAFRLHRGHDRDEDAVGEPAARWVALAVGAGMLAGWVDGLSGSRVDLARPGLTTFLAPAVAAAAFAWAARATDRDSSACRVR